MSAPHADVKTAANGLAKAWTFAKSGVPRAVLTLHQDRPLPRFPPEPHPSTAQRPEEWILVRVSHTGIGMTGRYHMAYLPPPWFRTSGPRDESIPEIDLAGTVLEVWHPHGEDMADKTATKQTTSATVQEKSQGGGHKVTKPHFKRGDQICASIQWAHAIATGCGALSDHVAIPAKFAVHRPHNVDPAQAAAIGSEAYSAGRGVDIVTKAVGLGRGGRVLVIGAASVFGGTSVQLLKQIVGPEGTVVGVCSGMDEPTVAGLGADEVVDWVKYSSIADELARRYGEHRLDAVIDCAGNQKAYWACASFLRKGGVFATYFMPAPKHNSLALAWATAKCVFNTIRSTSTWLGGPGRRILWLGMKTPGFRGMEELVAKVSDGRLRIPIDSVWSYKDVLGAYDIIYGRRACGKIIVKWDDDDEQPTPKLSSNQA